MTLDPREDPTSLPPRPICSPELRQPWSTAPTDGSWFVAISAIREMIGNMPEGCAFGQWRYEPHFNGTWKGYGYSYDTRKTFTHWRPLTDEERDTIISHIKSTLPYTHPINKLLS